MITEITGLPGNGKTLYALAFVKDWAERENRPVFYSGIAELTLPWTEIEPEKWFECPPRSIIVIDECQRVFRPRSMGKDVPEHVSKLETHRHQGVDIVLITQNPMLTDTAVRRLVGRHFHVVRKFGMQSANVYEWGSIKDNPLTDAARKDAIKHTWKYDKRVYGYYKSAEVHTVKARIPKKVFVMFAMPFLIAALAYYAVQYFRGLGHPKATAAAGSVAEAIKPVAPATAGKRPFDPVADARDYVAMNTPRVHGLPHTSPKFDEITKPTAAPVPVACVASDKKCLCYTQQGTRMDVRDQTCRDIAEFGFFEEFNPNGRDDKTARSVAVLDRQSPLPLSGVETKDHPVRASFTESDGYGVLGKRGGSGGTGGGRS
jgi:zona occludens toxin